jgi:aryl-alcohol dehydrogenase-like predicted oxidoreductase
MQYTNFGNTGLVVSRLSFGAMTFGQSALADDILNDIDQSIADQMVGRALDAGINCFDTADIYTNGESEIMLGKALKGKRDEVIIATKCGFRSSEAITDCGLSYRYILKAVKASLQRLNTDYIDLFQVHIPDPITPLEQTTRALDDVVRKGWVRYIGYSNYPAWQAQKMLDIQDRNKLSKFISAQMYYSLLGRDLEHEFVSFLEHNGLALMVWSPLAGGFLTGKYTHANPVPADSRRAKFDFPPIDVERGYEVVAKLKEIAEKYEASRAQIALAWLLAKSYVSSILIGASKIHQLEDNLGSANLTLSGEDVQALDEVTAIPAPYPAWMQPMGWDQKVRKALEGGTS